MAIEEFNWSGIKVKMDDGRIPGEYVLFAQFGRNAYSGSYPNEMPLGLAMRLVKKGLKMLYWDE